MIQGRVEGHGALLWLDALRRRIILSGVLVVLFQGQGNVRGYTVLSKESAGTGISQERLLSRLFRGLDNVHVTSVSDMITEWSLCLAGQRAPLYDPVKLGSTGEHRGLAVCTRPAPGTCGAASLLLSGFRPSDRGEREGACITHTPVPGTAHDTGQTLPTQSSPRPSPCYTDDETDAQRGQVLGRVKSNWQNQNRTLAPKSFPLPSLARRLNLRPLRTLNCVPQASQLDISCCRGSAWLSQASHSVSSRSGSGWSPVPKGVRGNEAP